MTRSVWRPCKRGPAIYAGQDTAHESLFSGLDSHSPGVRIFVKCICACKDGWTAALSRQTKPQRSSIVSKKGIKEMDDAKLKELRELVGQHAKLVYDAIKSGMVVELPHESQLYAQAVQEHMHLKHIHNALDFADVRDGEQYEIWVGGETVNPMAHIAAHSAVKGQIEQDPLVRAAFEKMMATGISAHHAEHVLGALLLEMEWEGAQAIEAGKDTQKVQATYTRKIQKLNRDSVFRKKLTRQFPDDHSAFE